MKKIFLLLTFILFLTSCNTTKNAKVLKKTPYKKSVTKTADLKTFNSNFKGILEEKRVEILKDAEKYIGVPYKYGGNTSAGFDCSGFIVKVYNENNKTLPRRSQDQSQAGSAILIQQIEPGDLLFFATAGGSKVSHAGIVHNIGEDGEIKFIHASTSKGVMISSLNERYWNKAFLFARRVL